jgi:hypothetical protein
VINIKRLGYNFILNSFESSNDPTVLKATYIILDFEKSWNNAIVTKDIGLELCETIINKPIVANYIPVTEINTSTDNFTGHEATLEKNKHGKDIVKTNTIPIGVFTTKGYLLTLDIDGEEKEVIAADAILWKSRFSDACELLVEWFNRGIKINTSCEFLYSNFNVQDGIEYINSPVYFDGHCHLASENRGQQGVVLPAYDSSQLISLNDREHFNLLITEALYEQKNNRIDEGEKVKYKKMFELSHDDIRSQIYQVLDPTLPEESYTYIYEVYDNHFVVEIYESNSYKTYDYTYSKGEDNISIDFDSKTEVKEKREWVAVNNQIQGKLSELETKHEELKKVLSEKESSLIDATLENEKVQKELASLESSLNESKEALTKNQTKYNDNQKEVDDLSLQLNELKVFKTKYEEEVYKKVLNEQQEFYLAKFNAFSALEKFNSEEVQGLIALCAKNDDSSENAKLRLNSIVVDLVPSISQKNNITPESFIREYSSRTENLLPDETDFDSKYK